MTRCRHQDWVDEYVLNRLCEKDKAAFEEHYFNCAACFEELKARTEVLTVIKDKGRELFKAVPERGTEPSSSQRKPAFFKPQVWWTAAAVAAAAVLIGVVLLIFRPAQTAPTFTLSGEDTVRGQAVGLVSPKGEIPSPPDFFEWKPLAEGIEYRISLYDQQRLWSQTTQEFRIRLPEEVRQRIMPGREYSWQVKAFSPRGALAAISSRQSFKITETR
jgi:hypothetical protein